MFKWVMFMQKHRQSRADLKCKSNWNGCFFFWSCSAESKDTMSLLLENNSGHALHSCTVTHLHTDGSSITTMKSSGGASRGGKRGLRSVRGGLQTNAAEAALAFLRGEAVTRACRCDEIHQDDERVSLCKLRHQRD